MENDMKKILAVVAVCGLLAWPAIAASPEVEAAIKTFGVVASNPDKLKTYCEMDKTMAASGDEEDEAKIAALDTKTKGYMKALGSDFQKAFEAGADLDPDSADGKAYDGAFDDLDKKCP
jgi:hypothetical protein